MPIKSLVLYHYPLSRSLRVLHLLHELDPSASSFEVKRMKLLAGEGYTESFLALNPLHAVPVVTFEVAAGGGLVTMTESTAILRFLAEEYHAEGRSRRLIPKVSREGGDDVATVADWERWFAFCATTMDSILWEMRVLNDFRLARPEEKELLMVWCAKWNNEVNPLLEAHFAQTEKEGGFASRWGFSILDCLMHQTLNWSVKYVRWVVLFTCLIDGLID